MDNIIVITQNLKLESLKLLAPNVSATSATLIVSTQLVYENERVLIDKLLQCNCKYIDFSELISDDEGERCDIDAFNPTIQGQDVFAYYDDIKRLKNELIVNRLLKIYPCKNKYLVCDDLGIDGRIWENAGFQKINLSYYFLPENSSQEQIEPINKKRGIKDVIRTTKAWRFVRKMRKINEFPLSVAHYKGIKYVFYGSLNRIGYRFVVIFKNASFLEKLRYWVDCNWHNTQPKTMHITTFHEGYHQIPDRKDLNVRIIQDGYLPSNYGSNYFYFYGVNTVFYTWDAIGKLTFDFFKLPSEIMPIRKKLYLPIPSYPKTLKKVVCAASGSADWTAIKNRSDENKLLVAIGQVAARFPQVEFVYRCHPVMAQPLHEGVNAINRNADYIDWLKLPNLHLSSNMPIANHDGNSSLSFKRSSFEEDLKGADVVFGEHSVSMIDAGLKGIVFASINVTGHRSYAQSLGDLGFPICTSVEDIKTLLRNICDENKKKKYAKAIDNYNKMTDIE